MRTFEEAVKKAFVRFDHSLKLKKCMQEASVMIRTLTYKRSRRAKRRVQKKIVNIFKMLLAFFL